MTPDDTRNFFQQEDDAWSRAIELALTPVVAAGIGYVIDRVVGTVPIFTILFLVLAVIGTFVKMYYAYDTKMKAHDAESPWGRAQIRGAARAAERDAARTGGAGKTPKRIRDAAADHAAANRAAADHVSSNPAAATAVAPAPAAADHAPAAAGPERTAADAPAGPAHTTAGQGGPRTPGDHGESRISADQGSNRS